MAQPYTDGDTLMVFALQSLIFYPFLLVLGVFVIWLAVRSIARATRSMTRTRAARLVRSGEHEVAARLLAGKGLPQQAAELLAEQGLHGQAADILVEAGDMAGAAKVAANGEDMLRAAELFQRADDLSSAAGCYLSAGNVGDAVRLLRQIGDLPTAARLMERREEHAVAIKLYMETKDFEKVATLAMEHVEDRPELKRIADFLLKRDEKRLALALYNKGQHCLEAGRLWESLGRLESALKAYLQHDYFNDAARVQSQLGNHREAAGLYFKGGLLQKTVEELLVADEYLAAARLFRRLGQSPEALAVLNKISRDSPTYKQGMLMAGSIEVESRHFEQAAQRMKTLLDVIGYSNESLEIIYRLVDLSIQLGRTEQAIASLEKAKRSGILDPGIDEQLHALRRSSDLLFASDEDSVYTFPLGRRAEMAGAATTIGFPRTDRYTLKRKLARGGHGILFLVEDNSLGREVVLKLLHSESLPSDLARKYFLREARTAAVLEHPNIVRVFDYGELVDRPYIAMEFVDGMNLLELQETHGGRLPRGRMLSACCQLCEALEYAHARSIVHRDIKMENVMLTVDWQVKLMDFGLAKALNENPDRSLFIIGTPFYMSPEQIVGDVLDHRTDLYSLGVLMYRLFTGKLPFEEGEVLSHHRFTPPPDPRELENDLPALLAETILTCLQKDRDQRFDSAMQIADRLSKLLGWD